MSQWKTVLAVLALVAGLLATGGIAHAAAANNQDELLNFDRSIKDSVDNFRILRTNNKAQMNDYVTRVFELKNAQCMEVLPYVNQVVQAEQGAARTLKYTDPATKKERNFIQVVCPKFQVPGIEELVKAFDLPGVASSPGDTRLFYRMQHRNAADVNAMLANTELSGEGATAVDGATNTIYYRDSASDFIRGLAVVKFMDVPVPQVELEVQVFELDRNEEAKLGLYWDAWKHALGGGITISAGNARLQGGNLGGYEALIALSSTTLAQFLNYLVENGAGKVLTKTRVSVQNNQQAVISSLRKIPYQAYHRHDCQVRTRQVDLGLADNEVELHTLKDGTAGDPNFVVQNVNQPGQSSVDPGSVGGEKAEGIYMRVTPTIGVRSLSANILVTVNSLVGYSKTDIPIISERRTQTVATLTPGKVLTLGGMDKETVVKEWRGIPGTQDIPVLKYLLGYHADVARKSVVVITVKPTIKNQLLYRAMALEAATNPVMVDVDADEKVLLSPNPAAHTDLDSLVKDFEDEEGVKKGAPLDLRWGYSAWGSK